jgi:hypothetical protein
MKRSKEFNKEIYGFMATRWSHNGIRVKGMSAEHSEAEVSMSLASSPTWWSHIEG